MTPDRQQVATQRQKIWHFLGRSALVLTLLAALVLPEQIQGLATSLPARVFLSAADCNRTDAALGRWVGENATRVVDDAEILSVSQQNSTAYPGRVALRVEVSARPTNEAWVVIAEGRYGHRNASDFSEPLEEKVTRPESGDCDSWARTSIRNAENSRWAEYFYYDGLWGERTYCFTVKTGANYAAIASGEYSISAPECHTTRWNPAWGWMEWPTNDM